MEQTLRYAEELRELHRAERQQRERVEESLLRLEASYRTTVRALAAALDLRDDMTGGHAERVTAFALRLACEVSPALLDDPQLEFGFLLHDVGKIGVPDAILLKPGTLDPSERAEMERHPLYGQRIVDQIPYLQGLTREIVVSHHERWDGAGYPMGLIGSGIPLAARIFSVADAFDAMMNDRPYRPALSLSASLEEIEGGAGTQFDPAVVEAFSQLVSRQAA